jgi:GT2 family glycosyltransferase
MPMQPDFSVVIPTLHRNVQLAEAIDSVIGQTGASVEVFVVDDSPDGEARVVAERYSPAQVHYLRMPTGSGGCPALVRNVALPLTKGRFIHFLDDDDIVPEGLYEANLATFDSHPKVGVVFGMVAPFSADATAMARECRYFAAAAKRALFWSRLGPRWGFSMAMFASHTLLVCGAAMIRRECAIAAGGFDPEMPIVEDVEFYARCIRAFGVVYVDRVTLNYRIWESLMHREGVEPLVIQAYAMMRQKYRATYGAAELLALRIVARLADKLWLMRYNH